MQNAVSASSRTSELGLGWPRESKRARYKGKGNYLNLYAEAGLFPLPEDGLFGWLG